MRHPRDSDPLAAGGSRAEALRAVVPYLLLAVAALSWAGNFVVGRSIHEQVPPITLNFGRWLVALAVLLPLSVRDLLGQRALLMRHWRFLGLLGATGVTLFHSCVYIALNATQVVNAALIMTATPVVIVLLSWLLFGERITLRQALGVGVSVAGAGVLIGRGNPELLLALDLNRGDLWMLVAVPNWALYSAVLRRRPSGLTPMVLLSATVITGLLLLAPLYLWELASGARPQINVGTIASVLYVGVFASVIAYVCWNRGVAAVGANRAGLFMHLMPVFSAALAVLFLGESIHAFHLAGMALVFSGIYLATMRAGGL